MKKRPGSCFSFLSHSLCLHFYTSTDPDPTERHPRRTEILMEAKSRTGPGAPRKQTERTGKKEATTPRKTNATAPIAPPRKNNPSSAAPPPEAAPLS
ncbi:hypothetical protein COCON_G00213010 [Conger conger]|uniref:Uncharacterized protein n=1 Tax=Conger conger TaxID=82655 RepID=A0A9Q1HNB3_CONCO|nr:hypothetical protein COCON_G00213010 [Conger conger]